MSLVYLCFFCSRFILAQVSIQNIHKPLSRHHLRQIQILDKFLHSLWYPVTLQYSHIKAGSYVLLHIITIIRKGASTEFLALLRTFHNALELSWHNIVSCHVVSYLIIIYHGYIIR